MEPTLRELQAMQTGAEIAFTITAVLCVLAIIVVVAAFLGVKESEKHSDWRDR